MLSIIIMVKHARRGPKRVARRRPARKSSGKKKQSSSMQFASITETIEFGDIKPNTSYGLVFTLSQFLRASAIAPNFRFYKAAKVVWSIDPRYNLYVDNGATPLDSVPYLYKVMDRTQDQLGFNLGDIQASGAKPIKLVNKHTMSYTPNWCSPGLLSLINSAGAVVVGGTSQGMKANYSYLVSPDANSGIPGGEQFVNPVDGRDPIPAGAAMVPVSTNSVVYNGMDIWVDQSVSQGDPLVARAFATVTWHFKGAKFNGYVRDPPQPIALKEA